MPFIITNRSNCQPQKCFNNLNADRKLVVTVPAWMETKLSDAVVDLKPAEIKVINYSKQRF